MHFCGSNLSHMNINLFHSAVQKKIVTYTLKMYFIELINVILYRKIRNK